MIRRIFDPLYDRPWRVHGYWFLAAFFLRLAIWYTADERWGRA